MLAALLLADLSGASGKKPGKKPGKNLPTWHVYKTEHDKREDSIDAFIDEQERVTKSAEVVSGVSPSVDAQPVVSSWPEIAPKDGAIIQPAPSFPSQDDLRALQRLHALEARQMIIFAQAAYMALQKDDEETLIAILLAID